MSKYIKVADRPRLGLGPLDHGAYSIRYRNELLRAHPEILWYVNAVRRGVVRDISPEGEKHLPMARRVILDQCCRKLATALLIEVNLTEDKVQTAAPVLDVWMRLNAQIRDDLKLLGLDRKALEVEILTPAELLLEVAKDEEEAAKAAAEPMPDQGEAEIEAPGASCGDSGQDDEGGA
jgi:hypothetical protein